MRFYAAWRLLFSPCLGRKGVRKMMNTEQYREHIERTFNAFCKIVLYHAALGAYKKNTEKAAVWSVPWLSSGVWFWACYYNRQVFLWNTMRLLLFTVRGKNGHCGKRAVGSRAFASARKAAGSAVFAVLPRLQRYGNREAVWSLQKYSLPQAEKSIAFAAKRNGGVENEE